MLEFTWCLHEIPTNHLVNYHKNTYYRETKKHSSYLPYRLFSPKKDFDRKILFPFFFWGGGGWVSCFGLFWSGFVLFCLCLFCFVCLYLSWSSDALELGAGSNASLPAPPRTWRWVASTTISQDDVVFDASSIFMIYYNRPQHRIPGLQRHHHCWWVNVESRSIVSGGDGGRIMGMMGVKVSDCAPPPPPPPPHLKILVSPLSI